MTARILTKPQVFRHGDLWVASWLESGCPQPIAGKYRTWQEAFDLALRAGRLFAESVAKFKEL